MIEILLFLIGGILFIASFILPERKTAGTLADTKKEEEKIKVYVETQLQAAKERIEEMTEEISSYSAEKAERTMERISNEKIMAVNEYSNTILKEIHRNHEEVMFLYDMLNNKQTSLKNTVQEVTKSAKQAEQTAKDAELTVKDMKQTAESVMEAVVIQMEKPQPSVTGAEDMLPTETTAETAEKKGNTGRKKTVKKTELPNVSVENQVEIQFAPGAEDIRNNNEVILGMHKEGKSNMAIARELGLGLGEVKLVIDLFEGNRT